VGGGGRGLGGGVNQHYHPNGGAPITREVPEHITFAQYTQVRSDDWYPSTNDVRSSSKQTLSGNHSKKNSSASPSSQVNVGGGGSSSSMAVKKKPSTARRPLVFTFNVNGSMVDVRCGEEERTNTFRLMPTDDECSRGGRASDEYSRGGRASGSTGEFDIGVQSSRTNLHDKHDRQDRQDRQDRHSHREDVIDSSSYVGNKRPPTNNRSYNNSSSAVGVAAVGSCGAGSRLKRHEGEGGKEVGGGGHNHRPCSVHYRVADVHRTAADECEPNKNSSEDEALLLWQKHL